MKTFSLSLFALAVAMTPAVAQFSAGPALEPLKVLETNLPVYPYDLIQLGVREGEAQIAFSVDANGNLEDSLAVAYTHPEFARVTLGAIKRWKFEPARFRGQPIAAATEVSVKFAVEGTVVVSLTPTETINLRLFSFMDGRDAYRPRALKELDRIPTPIATPSPAMPARFAKPGTAGNVTVSFYIDETGAVRLPTVNETDDPELGAAAIDALRNWKFEPPTCKGRPVLVRASQEFHFRSPQQNAAAKG